VLIGLEECHSRALPDTSGFDPLEKMGLGDDVNLDSIEMLAFPPSFTLSTSTRAPSVAISSTGVGNAAGAPTRPSVSNNASNQRSRPALSTISLNPTKASGNADKSNALPKSSEEDTTPTTTIVGSTPVIQPTIQPDMTLLATIPTCSTSGGIATGDDGNGGDGENETEVDEPGTASPILGFPSMFDLPPSPVLCFDELPVSWFTSPENSGDNPVPAPAPAPATSISASTASQGAITPNTPPGLKRKQPLIANEAVTASEEDNGRTLLANKRPRRLNTRGSAMPPATTGTQARGKGDAARKDVAGGMDVASAVTKKAAAKEGVEKEQGSSSSPSPSVVDPPWLTSALSMLGSEELGEGWKSLIQTWANFERKEDNCTPGVLGSTHRPAIVCDWIQRARSTSYRPVIKSTSEFQATFMKWWEGLQPDWRLSTSGQIITSNVSGDWGSLQRAGRNGILSVVAALFFWGLALKEAPDADRAGWNMASKDCLRVLNALIQ